MALKKKIYKKKLEGFSLIEISIVLLIIGIVAGAALKGRDILDSVRLKAIASDIQVLQIAYSNYVNSYDAFPGDDKNAASRFSGAENGDGDGKFSEADANKVFQHLYKSGFIESAIYKVPKIGGSYEMIAENGILKLRLSNSGAAFLSKKQVIALLSKCKEMLGNTDEIIEIDPKIAEDDSQKYILKAKIG